MLGILGFSCFRPSLRPRLHQPLRTFFGKKKVKPVPKIEDQISSSHRVPSLCDICMKPNDPKPCFNIENVSLEMATPDHENLIRAFLYTHYWPREPCCVGLYMPLDSLYLDILTDKYCTSGDRFLAFEWQGRGKERKMIGILIANKTFPWVADELEDWAINTCCHPERIRMYFLAHCLRNSNLFQKYHTDYIYEVEVLVTASEVMRQGVGLFLLKRALFHAAELHHPLMTMLAKSKYGAITCQRAGMKGEWSIDYNQYIDSCGHQQFFPRSPHLTATYYTKQFPCKGGLPYPA